MALYLYNRRIKLIQEELSEVLEPEGFAASDQNKDLKDSIYPEIGG